MTPPPEIGSPAHPRPGALTRALAALERAGNRLPEPIVLLFGLWALVLVASFIAGRRGASATHPGTGASIAAVDLLSREGLHHLLRDAPTSVTTLPRLGPVLVVLLGVGLAERSGLLRAAFSRLGDRLSPRGLTALLVLVSILSSAYGDLGLIALPALGACLFLANRRHPLAGAAAAFAGVTGGFGANLLLGAVDPLLAAGTEGAARLVDANRSVGAAANHWFAFASGLVLTGVATVVNHRWIEPRLGPWPPVEGASAAEPPATVPGPAEPRRAVLDAAGDDPRALRFAAIALLSCLVVLAALVVPERGLLRDDAGTPRPFFDALPVLVSLTLLVPSAVYGRFNGTFTGPRALLEAAGETLAALGPYLLLTFVTAQLLLAVDRSNLGLLLIIKGTRLFYKARLGGVPLLVAIVAYTAAADLLLPSATAKWAVLAPVVVKLAMFAGHPPEAAQAAFRVGDSPANMMTPLLPFYPLFIAVLKKYAPRAGAGTIAALTLPYSAAFFLFWTALLVAWSQAGLPFGPGAPP